MNERLSGLTPTHRDALRLAGLLILAAGIFALLIRKGEEWSDFPVLLVLAIPCALFYGLGIGALRLGPADDDAHDHEHDHAHDHVHDHGARHDAVTTRPWLSAWRATALVLGIIFVAFTLDQLVETIGGNPDKPGWVFFIFLVTALAAAYAAVRHGLRFGALLAGIALIISWIALWEAIVDPSTTTLRWLFLIIGAALAVAALRLHSDDRREAPELVTAAGLAGLAAGVTALFALAGALVGGALSSALGTEPDLSGGTQQGDEWNIFLLILALALIWYGARAAWRGPAYVGAIALIVFIVAVGVDVAALFDGEDPGDGFVGWPLILLLLGGAALAAGLLGGGTRGTPDTATRPMGAGGVPDAPTQPMTPPSSPPPTTPPPTQPPPPGPPGP